MLETSPVPENLLLLRPERWGGESRFILLPSLKMHFVTAGDPQGNLVFLLHGFPEFWFSWRKQIQPLHEAGYTVVVPDQRGYFLSEKTPPYDLWTLSDDIVALINSFGERPIHLIGHDWGAAVAWVLATRFPEKLKSLTILNVPHPEVMAKALMGGDFRQMYNSWYIWGFQIPWLAPWLLQKNHFQGLTWMMRSSSRRGTFSEEELSCYQYAWSQPGAVKAMLGYYRAMFKFASPSFRKKTYHRLQTPTQILWGEKDVALRTCLADESLKWLEQGNLIRFPQATHWVHEEETEGVNRALIDFLKKNS